MTSEFRKRFCKLGSGNIARGVSNGKDFFANEMQADHLWRFLCIEVATNSVLNIGVEFFMGIRIDENRFTQALAVYPPSGASSTIKRISFMVRSLGLA
jgi:hypothetical protein